jgi:hypothetical protein
MKETVGFYWLSKIGQINPRNINIIYNLYRITTKPVLKGHLWYKEKVAL